MDDLSRNAPLPPILKLTDEAEAALHDGRVIRSILATLPGVDIDDPRFAPFINPI
jgi:hypothetical protein